MVHFPDLTPRPPYPIEAEAPICEAFEDRAGWINVSPVAIATAALSALAEGGWRLIPPAQSDGDPRG